MLLLQFIITFLNREEHFKVRYQIWNTNANIARCISEEGKSYLVRLCVVIILGFDVLESSCSQIVNVMLIAFRVRLNWGRKELDGVSKSGSRFRRVVAGGGNSEDFRTFFAQMLWYCVDREKVVWTDTESQNFRPGANVITRIMERIYKSNLVQWNGHSSGKKRSVISDWFISLAFQTFY